MASIQFRVSRGRKYWSIVESRRINGKPRTFILEYLGTAETLLQRLQNKDTFSIKSYSHGDSTALINTAIELDIINTINKYIPPGKDGTKPIRDGLTVGASLLLAAIGRACHPTSKRGWYEWCKETSLEYCLKTSFKKLDSQHFWDQMNPVPLESIPLIEEEIVKKLINTYEIKLDCLFFDTTNFFTFIDSTNFKCDIAQRGKNKQKRIDLRQIGMALLVTRKEQFPLFHHTYRGNKNDITVFKETFNNFFERIKTISKELSDITIIFDKGNNSKENFKMIDKKTEFYYVAGLVPSYFKELIKQANKNFSTMKIDDKEVPVYRIKEKVWGEKRTCVVTISSQLKEGQIRGITQALTKKYSILEKFKNQLENPNRRKNFTEKEIEDRLKKIIKGQFIEEILRYGFIKLEGGCPSFTYFIDENAYKKLKEEILGRKIVVTNRHDWTNEEILLAYRGQAKIEYAFRCLKNPFHLAIRPQYHWTDQKIEVHILTCIIGYLLAVAVYTKAKKASYDRNINNLMEELKQIRLACSIRKKGSKVKYQLERLPAHLLKIAKVLRITNENLRLKVNFSDYK